MKKIVIFIVLLFIAIFSVSHSYAMFRSNSSSTATISGATFSVSATSNDTSMSLTAGSTEAVYTLNVKNNSEVNVVYTIELTNLPTGMKVKLDSGSYVTESNNKITFTDVGNLMVGGTTTRNHTLTFTAPLNSTEVSDQQANINVEFRQKLS